MAKVTLALLFTIFSVDFAAAQGTNRSGYSSARQALEALRAKPGVNISVQAGWTIIEDRANLTIWSFTPPGHRAYPAAIERKIVQEGGNIFVKMNVLCEAPKPDCDAVVAEFQALNSRIRQELAPKTR